MTVRRPVTSARPVIQVQRWTAQDEGLTILVQPSAPEAGVADAGMSPIRMRIGQRQCKLPMAALVRGVGQGGRHRATCCARRERTTMLLPCSWLPHAARSPDPARRQIAPGLAHRANRNDRPGGAQPLSSEFTTIRSRAQECPESSINASTPATKGQARMNEIAMKLQGYCGPSVL